MRAAALARIAGWLSCAVGATLAGEGTENSSARTSTINLPTVLRLAGARNLDVQIASERLREAEANRAGALLQLAPVITTGASYRRHENLTQGVDGRVIDADKESWTFGPTLTVQSEIGDVIYKNLISQQLVKAAAFASESQREESLLAAALAYFDLAKAQSTRSVALAAVAISEDYARQVKEAVEVGIAFKGEELRTQVQMERDRLTLRQTDEQQQLASARLVQVLHLDATIRLVARDATLPIEFLRPQQSLSSLLAQAWGHRPELKQSRAQLAAARHTRSAALYGPLFPTIGGQTFAGGLGGGAFGSDYQTGESEDYQATIGWRIGPGGLFDFTRTRAADARVNIADLTAQKVSDEIGRQVSEGYARVHSLADQIVISRRAISAARESLRLTRERKEFAVGNVLEGILSAQELTRARLEYFNIVAEHNKAQYTLSRAVGEAAEPRHLTLSQPGAAAELIPGDTVPKPGVKKPAGAHTSNREAPPTK